MIREYIGVFKANKYCVIQMCVFYRYFVGDAIRYADYRQGELLEEDIWYLPSPAPNASVDRCYDEIKSVLSDSDVSPIRTQSEVSKHLMLQELLR